MTSTMGKADCTHSQFCLQISNPISKKKPENSIKLSITLFSIAHLQTATASTSLSEFYYNNNLFDPARLLEYFLAITTDYMSLALFEVLSTVHRYLS